jgi:hypothetical protein
MLVYKYTVTPFGIALDMTQCPPVLGERLFPSGNWHSVGVHPESGTYEFLFTEKQEVAFKSDFIEITEEQVELPE